MAVHVEVFQALKRGLAYDSNIQLHVPTVTRCMYDGV